MDSQHLCQPCSVLQSLSLYNCSLQLHLFLSNVRHQCSDGPSSTGVPVEETQPEVEPWNEDDDNLSDTDSESEWNTGPGPLTNI